MWISRDKWLDLKLKTKIHKDTSDTWKENYERLLNEVTNIRTYRDETYYTKEGYRQLEAKHNQEKEDLKRSMLSLQAELESVKSVLRWKDEFIASLTQLIKSKEILNEKV